MHHEQAQFKKKALYWQIFEELKAWIDQGKLKEGDKIPSEKELCDIFNVSRITVRQAISEAINIGLVYRVQGKGSYVVDESTRKEKTKIIQKLSQIIPFSKTTLQVGLKGKTIVLSGEVVPGILEINNILNLDRNEHLFYLQLMGIANGYNLVVYNSYFPLALGKQMYLVAKEKEKKEEPFSSYELYAKLTSVYPSYVEQSFEACSADAGLASLLLVEEGSPLLYINSLVYSTEDLPLEFKKAYYRGDKYKFHITRQVPEIALKK